MEIMLLLTDGFGGYGGIAKFNRDLLSALCSHSRVRHVTALPRLVPADPGKLPARLRYVTAAAGGLPRYLRHALAAARRRPDLLLCGHINLLPIASLCSWVAGVPFVLVIHGIECWQPTSRALTNRLARRVRRFISVSEFSRGRFCAWSGVPPSVGSILPNCVDLSLYGPGPKPAELEQRYGLSGRTVILTLARLSSSERYKGVDEILEVLPALAARLPSISYVIAGDGDDRARLEAKARNLGIESRVIFAGRIQDAEKAAHYRLADVFAMPSRGEGFGIVYLEAMACGIPVVASRLDAGREALREGQLGTLVDQGDPADLERGLLEALRQPRGVPPGLDYFSYPNFEKKVHTFLNQQFSERDGIPARA